MDIVKFLLRKSPDGSYLLPGVKVMEDMLMIMGQRPEMRGLLEMHLGQQRINAPKHCPQNKLKKHLLASLK